MLRRANRVDGDRRSEHRRAAKPFSYGRSHPERQERPTNRRRQEAPTALILVANNPTGELGTISEYAETATGNVAPASVIARASQSSGIIARTRTCCRPRNRRTPSH